MNTAWEIERWRLGLTVLMVPVIGWLTGYWILAFLLPISSYIAWNLYQLYRLERWLASGVKPRNAPDAGGIWALIVQHIHRNERADKKRKKRYKELLNRMNTAIAALPGAAVVLNGSREVEWANSGAEHLLGVDRKRDLGTFIGNLIREPDFLEHLQNPDGRKELEIRSPVDHKKNISVTLTPFGKKQFLMTSRDISERVELGRIRKAFIANASHELRTPLTVIAGYLEILQSAPEMPESLQEPVRSARDQANRMESLIHDLLTLSRLESTALPDDAGNELDVAKMVRSVVADLEQTVARDSHQFHLNLDEGLNVNAIEMEVEGVVLNLCRNAVLHTPMGTEIQVNWGRDSFGNACFTVRDNGDGIPEGHLSRLTERFYRVDAGRSREVGGTGLGLSITRHVMERYGGDLLISSEVGEFAEFQVRFPKKCVVA
ncbi:MAG TPA: phosphate regulon sensor histidine kinase PhoR [Gammaproteobacteria bacterium]|jgi:two-component system phosphate regulon sensor histidine kinase PhoR|nr:phosphate regulon sensor histidine kinase PhoR [Gammaproteobacteria bacterium]